MPFLIYQALAADPLLAGVRQVWGSHYIEEQASPPRIVWGGVSQEKVAATADVLVVSSRAPSPDCSRART